MQLPEKRRTSKKGSDAAFRTLHRRQIKYIDPPRDAFSFRHRVARNRELRSLLANLISVFEDAGLIQKPHQARGGRGRRFKSRLKSLPLLRIQGKSCPVRERFRT